MRQKKYLEPPKVSLFFTVRITRHGLCVWSENVEFYCIDPALHYKWQFGLFATENIMALRKAGRVESSKQTAEGTDAVAGAFSQKWRLQDRGRTKRIGTADEQPNWNPSMVVNPARPPEPRKTTVVVSMVATRHRQGRPTRCSSSNPQR